ncbi:MAG TPA: DUF3592 domain-containing protein [Gemmata sp.]
MRKSLLVLVAYFVLVALLWFGIGSLNIPHYRRLAAEGVQTEATITGTTCEQHSVVSYTFAAGDGQVYVGRGLSGGDKPCQDIRVGDRMPVWYIPADPTTSTLREPQAELENERLSVGCGAIFMPAWVLVIIFGARWIQRARSK